MKQNVKKLNNRIFTVFLAVVLLLPAFAVPVAADSDYFLALPTFVPSQIVGQDEYMQHVYDITGTYPTYAYCSQASDEVPVYLALVQKSGAASGAYNLYGFSKTEGGVVWKWREYHAYPGTTTYPTNSTAINLTQSGFDNVYYAEVYSVVNVSTTEWDPSLPVYSSLDAALTAFSTWTPTLGAISTFTLDPGNVAYIDLQGFPRGQYNLTFKTTRKWGFDLSSYLSTQVYVLSDNLPTTTTSYPLPQSTTINWLFDDDGLYNAFGRSFNYVYHLDGSSGGHRYLVIYNPLYIDPNNPNSQYVNNTMTIKGIYAGQVPLVYPVTQLLMQDQNGAFYYRGTIKQEDIDDPMTAVGGEEGGIIIPSNSKGETQQFGGGNEVPEEVTVLSTLDKIKETLTNFVDKLVELLSAPVSHIQQLIQAGSAYIQSLSELYAWLPPELSNTIISALIVVITIGVFKAFL